MTNPLKNKDLVRGAWCLVATAAILAACGKKPSGPPTPAPTAPFPAGGLAGQRVSLVPISLVAADEAVGWDSLLTDHRATLLRADSVIAALLPARTPEVNWVLPDELRREARRAPGIATDPDQLGTAVLRAENMREVLDPLRAQLRTLGALGGGRYVVAPAAIVFRPAGPGLGTAELSIVLVDVRLGKIDWRTVARGEGRDPWTALARAVKALTPGLP
ncbi:MAG TPA: hypothetical protein VF923_00130 [Gemmatimonadales bacterium]